MMYRFKVLVDWPEERKTFRESGLVGASNYGEAVAKITDNYGEDNIIELKVYALCDVLCDHEVEEELELNYYQERRIGASEPPLNL